MDCITNTPWIGIVEDRAIVHRNHMIAFVVSWIEYQGQSNNFVIGYSVSYTVVCPGTSHENISSNLWIVFLLNLNLEYLKIVPSPIYNYDGIWLHLLFVGLNSKDNQTIWYLVIVLFAHPGTSLEDITKL